MTPPPSTGATTPHSTHAIYNNISSNNKTNNTQTDFEEVWALFPKKKDYDSKSRESERADIKAAVIRYAAERKGLEKDQYTITGGNFFVNERWREYVPTQEEIEAVKIPQISESNGIPSEKLTELWELAQKQSDPLQYFKSFCRMEVSQ